MRNSTNGLVSSFTRFIRGLEYQLSFVEDTFYSFYGIIIIKDVAGLRKMFHINLKKSELKFENIYRMQEENRYGEIGDRITVDSNENANY